MELPVGIRNRMEQMDSVTYNHSHRVWMIALGLEAHYRMPDDCLSTAAFVHDIGKLYISSRILDKHGELDKLEREIVDLHPYIGYRMLEEFKMNEVVKRIVLYHHGMNPKLLSPIPEFYSVMTMDKAKMLQTIDAFEALTTDRPYRRRMSVEQAVHFLQGQEGYHNEVLRYLDKHVKDFE